MLSKSLQLRKIKTRHAQLQWIYMVNFWSPTLKHHSMTIIRESKKVCDLHLIWLVLYVSATRATIIFFRFLCVANSPSFCTRYVSSNFQFLKFFLFITYTYSLLNEIYQDILDYTASRSIINFTAASFGFLNSILISWSIIFLQAFSFALSKLLLSNLHISKRMSFCKSFCFFRRIPLWSFLLQLNSRAAQKNLFLLQSFSLFYRTIYTVFLGITIWKQTIVLAFSDFFPWLLGAQ